MSAIALRLWPVDGDGAFVVHDALWYGMLAERAPEASLNPNHPAFHALVLPVMRVLRAMDVADPGHRACRIVAGLGALWLVLQIAALAGRRFLVGSAFALVLLASRGFVVDTAAGENVIPAAGAALFALTCAARPAPNLLVTAVALTCALLLRQDNVTIVPGVALALARGGRRGSRLAALLKVGIATAVATIAGYLAAFLFSNGGILAFPEWLPGIGSGGAFSGPGRVDLERLTLYASSLTAALTGRIGADPDPIAGLAYLGVVIAAGWMLRGAGPRLRLAAPAALTLVTRMLFHAWFEAGNFEWLILPAAIVIACAAAMAAGAPATSLAMRRAGIASLILLAAWLGVAHGPSTWALRERTFMGAVERVIAVDRGAWRFVSASVRADQALTLLGVPHARLASGPAALDDLHADLAAHAQPTTVLWDRGLIDGMPWSIEHGRSARVPIDTMEVPANWEKLHQGPWVFGARWTPPATVSRPQTRR